MPEARFLIISGGSGTGKSSLVDAGILPRIEENGFGGDKKYIGIRMSPTQKTDPFSSLVTVLGSFVSIAGLDPDSLADNLKDGPERLTSHLRTIMSDGTRGSGLVLFLDQMEELFTVQKDYVEPLLAELYKAVNETSLRVLATIRSDFLQHCHGHDSMRKVISGRGHIALGPLDAAGLRDVILEPARCAGLIISNQLVRRLVEAAGQERGSLPLLVFALKRLFEKRSGNELTEDVYNAFGGLDGAIRQHAESVEAKISETFKTDPKELLSEIFKRLVVITVDKEPTRRRASPSDFAEALIPVKDLLVNERLLTADEGTISVAHEKLFAVWPMLTSWVVANRDDYFLVRHAEIAGDEWQKHSYDTRYLWHADRLNRLREVIRRFDKEQIKDSAKDSARLFASPQGKLLERLKDYSLPHRERLDIGQYLAELGGSPRGVGLDPEGVPLIEWVKIEGGKVKLEDVKEIFNVKPFRIAKYAVTNVQFEAFIKAEDGYQNGEWWTGIKQEQASVIPRFAEANFTRETVSWFEAVAFCRWLTERYRERDLLRKDQQVRLPTEWEWQLAATGGDPNQEYPWPGGWDPSRCNSAESRLGRTTAVGMYPNGATVQGVLDMAGNVWEWCLNRYENPASHDALQVDADERGQRVMRGGSWGNFPGTLCVLPVQVLRRLPPRQHRLSSRPGPGLTL